MKDDGSMHVAKRGTCAGQAGNGWRNANTRFPVGSDHSNNWQIAIVNAAMALCDELNLTSGVLITENSRSLSNICKAVN